MKKSHIITLLATLFLCICSMAQEDEKSFYLRPTLGVQGAQIDGDYYAGYNQAGVLGGLQVGRQLNEKTSFQLALFFSQKGARQNANPEKEIYDYYRARLNYVELPIGFTHNFKAFDVYAGAYYGRLISAKEENQNGVFNADNPFKANDIGYYLGFEKKLMEKFYLGARFSYSLVPVREYFFNNNIYYYNIMQRLFNKGLYNNTLTFYLQYNIYPGKKSE